MTSGVSAAPLVRCGSWDPDQLPKTGRRVATMRKDTGKVYVPTVESMHRNNARRQDASSMNRLRLGYCGFGWFKIDKCLIGDQDTFRLLTVPYQDNPINSSTKKAWHRTRVEVR